MFYHLLFPYYLLFHAFIFSNLYCHCLRFPCLMWFQFALPVNVSLAFMNEAQVKFGLERPSAQSGRELREYAFLFWCTFSSFMISFLFLKFSYDIFFFLLFLDAIDSVMLNLLGLYMTRDYWQSMARLLVWLLTCPGHSLSNHSYLPSYLGVRCLYYGLARVTTLL
jgi:hypothetical protein